MVIYAKKAVAGQNCLKQNQSVARSRVLLHFDYYLGAARLLRPYGGGIVVV